MGKVGNGVDEDTATAIMEGWELVTVEDDVDEDALIGDLVMLACVGVSACEVVMI